MPQKNETPALVLTFLITASLIGGGFWCFRQASTSTNPLNSVNFNSPSSSIAPAALPPNAVPLNRSNPTTLASDRNVDYSQLNADLQRKDWKAADRETYLRLLDAAGPKA